MKKGCLFLAVLLIFLTLRLEFSYAASIDTQQKFFDMLVSEGLPKTTDNGKLANFTTYTRYNLIVYGEHWGDSKVSGSQTERRYLGYTSLDEPFENPIFPVDSNTGKPYEDFNYIKVSNADNSWKVITNPEQLNYMLNATLIGDRATNPNFTIASIGGKSYAKLLSPASWQSEGSAYFNHFDSKVWYVVMNIAPMVGNSLILGDISTPSDTYYIRSNESSVAIPTTVNAKALITGQANASHINEIRATFQNQSNVAKRTSSTSVTRDFIATRDNYPPGTYTVELKGNVSLTTIFNDIDSANVSKTIKLIVEESGDKPYVNTTVTPVPSSKKFDGIDTPVKLTVKGVLQNYTKLENIKEWVFYAAEKDAAEAVVKKVYAKTLSAETTFDFKIPAAKVIGDDYQQEYKVRARVFFNTPVNGQNYYDAPANSFVNIYKDKLVQPTTPPTDENKPPVALITAPLAIKAGEDFNVSGAGSYDTDGTIQEYFWGLPSSGLTLNDMFGTVWYPETAVGNQSIFLNVRDDDDAWGSGGHDIIILPPTPVASLKIDGVMKENRRLMFSNTSTSPTHYPLVPAKTVIEIKAIEGGNNLSVKFNGTLTDASSKEFLIKEEGIYEVKIYVENILGLSDTKTYTLFIRPDLNPVAEFSLIPKIYRDKHDFGFATIDINNMSYSPDGDKLTNVIWSVTYNNNNLKYADGSPNFTGSTSFVINEGDLMTNTEKTITHNGFTYKIIKLSDNQIKFKTNQVGYYRIELTVDEEFGQVSLPNFLIPSDYKSSNTLTKHQLEKTVKVENQPPFVDFAP